MINERQVPAYEHLQGMRQLSSGYPRNILLRSIREIDAYSWLHEFKAHGEVRRYPGLRRRTKADDEKEEAESVCQPEAQEEIGASLPAYRRF